MTILAGTGNNGGDGLVVARQLAVRGWMVRVCLSGEPDRMSNDCRTQWEIIRQMEPFFPGLIQSFPFPPIPSSRAVQPHDSPIIRAAELPETWPAMTVTQPLIVDALLGTAATGALREPIRSLCRWANAEQAVRVAIDVPTGVNPDTGEADPDAFRADHTLTIATLKPFALADAGGTNRGEVTVIPLGLPESLLHLALTEQD